MYTKTTTICNPTGLHARPATTFVTEAKKYKSEIRVQKVGADKTANAKTVVMLMCLGLSKGTEIQLTAEGEDEQKAVDALVSLIESGFGE